MSFERVEIEPCVLYALDAVTELPDTLRHAIDVENAEAAQRRAETSPIHERHEWWSRAATAWAVVETTCRKETRERDEAAKYCWQESLKWMAVERLVKLTGRDDPEWRQSVYDCLQ